MSLYSDSLTPEDFGYIDEKDSLDREQIKDYLQGVIDAIYVTGDTNHLEDMVEELAHQVNLNYQTKELKIKKTEENMNKEIQISENAIDQSMVDIQNIRKTCEALMKTPHYKRIGAEGIFAIVEKAKSVGISPLSALNGGLYFVSGKVEMSAATMNKMIRKAGHSISKDSKSDEKICILHGKRADNGDTWTESFSINDAKLAGIYRNQWVKYPKDMLFARALSRLARQLFPDVIDGCYVEGELSAESYHNDVFAEAVSETKHEIISDEQYQEIELLLEDNFSLRQNFLSFLKERHNISTLQEMPSDIYDMFYIRAKKEYDLIKSKDSEKESNNG